MSTWLLFQHITYSFTLECKYWGRNNCLYRHFVTADIDRWWMADFRTEIFASSCCLPWNLNNQETFCQELNLIQKKCHCHWGLANVYTTLHSSLRFTQTHQIKLMWSVINLGAWALTPPSTTSSVLSKQTQTLNGISRSFTSFISSMDFV